MKKIVIAAIVASIVVFGCSKGNKTENDQASSYTMKGTVNGAQWNAVCYSFRTENGAGIPLIVITSGDTGIYPYIKIRVPLDTEIVRTIDIANLNDPNTWHGRRAVCDAEIDSSYNQWTESAYGTLTITQKFPDILGTVSFTCLDSTKVVASFKCKTP